VENPKGGREGGENQESLKKNRSGIIKTVKVVILGREGGEIVTKKLIEQSEGNLKIGKEGLRRSGGVRGETDR